MVAARCDGTAGSGSPLPRLGRRPLDLVTHERTGLLVPPFTAAGFTAAVTAAEEQIDNEKYEYKDRRWDGPSLAPYLTRLNEIRLAHPALHWLRNLRFHRADDDNVLVFSKARRIYDRDDVVIVVANLDPSQTRETWIHLTMPDLGLGWPDGFVAHDLITGQHWNWAEHTFVRLGPDTEPVHIVHVQPH